MSWWSDQGGAGYSVISLTTVGDQQEAPHHHMPGGVTGAVRDVPDAGEMNQAVVDVAEATASLGVAEAYLDELNSQLTDLQAAIAAATSSAVKSSLQLARATIQAAITSQNTIIADIEAEIATAQAIIDGDNLHPYTVYARATYPHWDGSTNTLPAADRPSDFGTTTTDPAPDTFASWHSSYQAEWLNTHGDGPGAVTTMNIDGTEVHYLLSADGATVLPVNTIELSEIGVLSQADQQAIIDSDAWDDIAARLGVGEMTDYYTTSAVTGGDPVINWKIDTLDTLKDTLTDSETISAMGADDVETFSKQVDLLEERIMNGAIISIDLIDEMAAEIAERLTRALSFANTDGHDNVFLTFYQDSNQGGATQTGTLHTAYAAYSTDRGETVDMGYDEFMRAERAILASKLARASIAPVSGGFSDPRLDVPNLIYRLQSLYETEQEGVADGGTEELLQLYALLDDYAVMQQMVNETIKAYDADDTDQKRRFMDVGGTSDNSAATLYIRGNDVSSMKISTRGDLNSSAVDVVKLDSKTSYGKYNWFYSMPEDNSVWEQTDTFTHGMIDDDADLSEEQMLAFYMFASDTPFRGDLGVHPIESMYGIDRPTQQFLIDNGESGQDLERYKKTTWDTFSTELSDAVTQLNQQVQIKQNEIDDASKQQNRHYELGSNALSKMYDMLQSISSF